MSGKDLDFAEMDQGTIYRRLRLAVNSLGLVCRICNARSSCEGSAEAHKRGNRHDETVDSWSHRRTMIELGYSRPAYWCNLCGKDVLNVAAHVAGKGHRRAAKVEFSTWSARLAIRMLCNELRRRNLKVPDLCPEDLSVSRRCPLAADGGSAKAAAAGVVDEDLAEQDTRTASSAARGLDRPGPRASASAGDADRRGVLPGLERASGDGGANAGVADRRGGVMGGFVRASGANADDVALALGLGLDRELAKMSSGMRQLAEVSSTIVDGLGALRDEVKMLMANVRERENFEREMFVTSNTLCEGMQTIAAQRSVFEAHVLGSLKTVSQELEALRASQAGRGSLPTLKATVILAEVDKEQDKSR